MLLPAEACPEAVWDVVVAGAGPAGATTAAHVARAGHRVLLLDRHGFPRDKVCGDGLIADTLAALSRLGALDAVRARARRLTTTSIVSASRHRVEIQGEFLTLKRQELDGLIAAQAVANGAVMAQGTVTDIRAGAQEVTISIEAAQPASIRARFAVIATGADLRLTRAGQAGPMPAPSALAARCYVRSAATIDELVISYDREVLPGYAWIFPLADGEYNVGCGLFHRGGYRGNVNLRALFDRFVTTFPEARTLMREATTTTPLKGAPLRCGLPPAPASARAPRVLSIGETIGTTFPFTGEGIGKAMETGEIAATTLRQALERDEPACLSTFPAAVHDAIGPRYVGYRAAERYLSYAWVTDVLARRARRSPFLRHALAGILNETIDPRTVFSLGGLARSLFS